MSNSFATPWTIAHQVPLSTAFPKQECWSGLPFPSPGDLPNPRIKLRSPALAGKFFTTEPPGESWNNIYTMELYLYYLGLEGNPAIWNNTNEWIWRAYAKWKKSDRGRQMLHGITYMWNLKKKKKKKIIR